MKNYEVWCEGFMITGGSSPAHKVGECKAKSFKDACCKLYRRGDDSFNKENLTHWGCRLFPTEAAARRSFG
jgi:hypothetical protein